MSRLDVWSPADFRRHVVLRNRPDLVAAWSDEEIARRWWNLFPGRRAAFAEETAGEPIR
jgi:hypothetical protein